MDLTDFSLNPATLLVLIFGLVEFCKTLGLEGRRLRLLSMALGVLLAGLYRLRELFPAHGAWIELGFFGLAAGLAASGLYDYLHAQFKSLRLIQTGARRPEPPARPEPRYDPTRR